MAKISSKRRPIMLLEIAVVLTIYVGSVKTALQNSQGIEK